MRDRVGFWSNKGRVVALAFLSGLIVLAGGVDMLFPQPQRHIFVAHPAELDLRVPGAALQKAAVFHTDVTQADSFNIELSGLALSDYYTNFFQTSDGPRAIRLELVHPNALYLALGQSAYIRVSDHFSLGDWHKIVISGQKDGIIKLSLDGLQTFTSESELAPDFDFSFDKIVAGSGLSGQRGLQGAISDFAVAVSYNDPLSVLALVHLLIAVVIAIAASFAAWRAFVQPSAAGNPSHGLIGYARASSDAASFAILSIGLLLGLSIESFGSSIGKWAVLAGLASYFPGFMLLSRLNQMRGCGRLTPKIGAASLALICLMVVLVCGLYRNGSEPGHLPVIGITALLVAIILERMRQPVPGRFGGGLEIFLVSAFTIYVLSSTPNWQKVQSEFNARPIIIVFCISLAFTYINISFGRMVAKWWIVCAKAVDKFHLARFAGAFYYFIIGMFALRVDELRVGGASFHWSYFALPVQAVRDGGWLLWDVPSQYGFLSILLPAFLPISSAWNALYAFQALTLFIAAALFFNTLYWRLGWPRLFAFVLVIAAFFAADPALVGPAAFPSSSAMRFLWCYVLLAVGSAVFFGKRPVMAEYIRGGTIPWLAGMLWSAESAIYVTAMLFGPLAMHGMIGLMSKAGRKTVLIETGALLLYPILWLGIVVAMFCVIYLARIGHLPDIRMYFQYGSAYAAGFGALPVVWDGPIWIFALVLAGGLAGIVMGGYRRDSLEGPAGAAAVAIACAWVVASYYVGRAAPSNVTALLPLLCFAMAIILSASAKEGNISRLQVAVALPLFAIALTSLWQRGTLQLFGRLRPFPQSVVPLLPRADPELLSLMNEAHISLESRVTYYGYAAAMPTIGDANDRESFERPWLFGPPQLLEKPINSERRALIFARFAERHHEPGFFVQKRGEAEDRADEWLSLISSEYRVTATYVSDHYRITATEAAGDRRPSSDHPGQ